MIGGDGLYVKISVDNAPGRIRHLISEDFPGPFTQSHSATGIPPFGAAIFQAIDKPEYGGNVH